MAHALRRLRWKSIWWTLGIAVLLSVAARVSAREVRVGVLIDGPSAREGISADALEHAAKAVYGDGLALRVAPQTRLDGNWNMATLNAALDRLEADPQVDVVVTLGFAASHLVAHRARLPKPTIAASVLDPVLFPWLLGALLVLVGLVALDAHADSPRILDRWVQHPSLLGVPVATALGAWVLLGGTWRRGDDRPFLAVTGIFAAAFAAIAMSFWPYMLPYLVTVAEGASPPESTWFMFWGAGLVALPLTLGNTLIVYHVFRGKLVDSEGYE
jgi:Cytochrome bd terminal oxidase subunit II